MKLSYGAKTLLLEISGTRRDFIKSGIIVAGGLTFLGITLGKPSEVLSRPADMICGCYSDCYSECYSNCHCACHGRCGRKGW